MASQSSKEAVKWPSREEQEKQFDAYALAVGGVVQAWNHLHDRLCDIFVEIVNSKDKEIASAVWHSTYNDRAQREMLFAAVNAATQDFWKTLSPAAKDDITWLLHRINDISAPRDNAIHAPVSLFVDSDGPEVIASPYSNHRRAKNLRGKRLLVEFDWCERCATELGKFATRIWLAMDLDFDAGTWLERPSVPDRKPRTAFPSLRNRRLPPELPPRRP